MPGQHGDALFVAFDPFRPRHGRHARRPNTDVEQALPPSHSLPQNYSSTLTPNPTYNYSRPQGQAIVTIPAFGPPAPVIIHAPTSVPPNVHYETREASFSGSNPSMASLPAAIPESRGSSSHLSSRPSSIPEQPPLEYDQPEAPQSTEPPRGRPRSRSPSFLFHAQRAARRPARNDNVVFADDLPYDEEYVLRSRAPSPTRDYRDVTEHHKHHYPRSRSRSRSLSSIYAGRVPRDDDQRPHSRQSSRREYEMYARQTYLHPLRRPSPSHRSDILSSSLATENLDPSLIRYILVLLFETVPQQIYLHFLLRLPSLYFSRVTRIFEDAELSLSDIEKMAATRMEEWNSNPRMAKRIPSRALWHSNLDHVSPALKQFKSSWEDFVDSLINEWKVLNVISALLASAILSLLQLDAAMTDVVTKCTALLSLVCALMSLLYCCMYIIRFGTMRKMHKAASWADEARQTEPRIIWNVWVMLAMPAVWLCWAVVLFLVSIMAFVWRSGLSQTFEEALGPRIAISAVLLLGLAYIIQLIGTFRRYGDLMDQLWRDRLLSKWTETKTKGVSTESAAGIMQVPSPQRLPPRPTFVYSGAYESTDRGSQLESSAMRPLYEMKPPSRHSGDRDRDVRPSAPFRHTPTPTPPEPQQYEMYDFNDIALRSSTPTSHRSHTPTLSVRTPGALVSGNLQKDNVDFKSESVKPHSKDSDLQHEALGVEAGKIDYDEEQVISDPKPTEVHQEKEPDL